MCYMPWHLPWKLNLLNCCLESCTSINWRRGNVDIWLSDISRRDGLHQPQQHICGSSTSVLLNTVMITISLMHHLYYWNSSYCIYTSVLDMRHLSQSDFEPIRYPCCKEWWCHKSYLLLLSALQIPPLLCYVAEVHLVHGHLDVANGIVLREAVKIVHRHYQRLPAQLYIGDLKNKECH